MKDGICFACEHGYHNRCEREFHNKGRWWECACTCEGENLPDVNQDSQTRHRGEVFTSRSELNCRHFEKF